MQNANNLLCPQEVKPQRNVITETDHVSLIIIIIIIIIILLLLSLLLFLLLILSLLVFYCICIVLKYKTDGMVKVAWVLSSLNWKIVIRICKLSSTFVP